MIDSMTCLSPRLAGLVLCLLASAWALPVMAQEPVLPQTGRIISDAALNGRLDVAPAPAAPQYASEVEAYCANIADAARDQRYLRQKQELEQLRAEVDERVKLLEQRRDEFEEWVARREAFIEVAEGQLTKIYQEMRADSAAAQLELIAPEVAAAIVMKLDPRLSSQILNEMEAKNAAILAGIIADAASKQLPKEPS